VSATAPLWIKICANTSFGDAQLAVEAGADAVGFVLARSPRRLTVEQVAEITPRLSPRIEKIGVFVDASLEQICTAVGAGGLTGIQLHSDAAADVPARMHEAMGRHIRVLRVVHFGPGAAAQAQGYAADPHVDAVLVDSRTATAVGGTGIRFDWSEARRTLFADRPGKLIVAGGLSPENVAEAVATLQPYGVDVVSGVEAAPGRKDPEKVRAFIARARAAAAAWAGQLATPDERTR
jgi:phosphoribosylanthranilate isomerase